MTARPLVVVFAGTRDLDATGLVRKLIYELPEGTIVLHGGNGAIDLAAHRFARERGLITGVFDANWRVHGKPGGPKRTLAMMQLAPDRVYVIWDGKSPGSLRARDYARLYELDLHEHVVNRAPPLGPFLIEFRSGSYFQGRDADTGGPPESAEGFDTREEAETFMRQNPWIVLNGGMVVPRPRKGAVP